MKKRNSAKKYAYIYVISEHHGEAPVKIGIAHDVEKRIKSLQTGNSNKLYAKFVYPAGYREIALHIEQTFHRIYQDEFGLCGEWFQMSVEEAKQKLGWIIFDSLIFKSKFAIDDARQVVEDMGIRMVSHG